jgi:hypothetical protein
MGLFGGGNSSSSSSTETNTQNISTTLGADNGSFVTSGGVVQITDGGAFDLIGDVVDDFIGFGKRSLEFGEDSLDFGERSLDVAGDAFSDVITAMGRNFTDAVDLVDRTSQQSSRQSSEALIQAAQIQEKDSTEISKLVLIGAAIIAGIAVLPKLLK